LGENLLRSPDSDKVSNLVVAVRGSGKNPKKAPEKLKRKVFFPLFCRKWIFNDLVLSPKNLVGKAHEDIQFQSEKGTKKRRKSKKKGFSFNVSLVFFAFE
jgi:hypothetical protein